MWSRAFGAEGIASVKPQGQGRGEREERKGTDPLECLLCARHCTQCPISLSHEPAQQPGTASVPFPWTFR